MEPDEDYDPIADLEKLDRFLEGKEQTTLYFELEKRGWAPPAIEGLSDEEVSRALTDLVWSLFDLHFLVEFADHFSDRDLYAQLLDYCDEPNVVFYGEREVTWCHWSPWTEGLDEWEVYLRYYASEDDRAQAMIDHPEWPVPAAETPGYPRPWVPKRPGWR